MGVAAGHPAVNHAALDDLFAHHAVPTSFSKLAAATSVSGTGALGVAVAPALLGGRQRTAFAALPAGTTDEKPPLPGNPAMEGGGQNPESEGNEDGNAPEGALKTAIKHKADVPWTLDVEIQRPEEADLQEGQGIIPLDANRAKLRDLGKQGGLDYAALRKKMAAERKARFEDGEEVKDEEIPDTLGETAHQLMQSGDYGDGPPWPLKNPAPPPWRGTQPETGEVIFTETKKLGQGKSVEFIRCFEGDTEVPCGGCKGKLAEAEEASMGGTGPLAVPSIMLMAASRGPGAAAGTCRKGGARAKGQAVALYSKFL